MERGLLHGIWRWATNNYIFLATNILFQKDYERLRIPEIEKDRKREFVECQIESNFEISRDPCIPAVFNRYHGKCHTTLFDARIIASTSKWKLL